MRRIIKPTAPGRWRYFIRGNDQVRACRQTKMSHSSNHLMKTMVEPRSGSASWVKSQPFQHTWKWFDFGWLQIWITQFMYFFPLDYPEATLDLNLFENTDKLLWIHLETKSHQVVQSRNPIQSTGHVWTVQSTLNPFFFFFFLQKTDLDSIRHFSTLFILQGELRGVNSSNPSVKSAPIWFQNPQIGSHDNFPLNLHDRDSKFSFRSRPKASWSILAGGGTLLVETITLGVPLAQPGSPLITS